MVINFVTPTQISPLDLKTMGDSVKRGDESKTGRFGSGLKYSIAILLRNGVEISISSGTDTNHRQYSFYKETVTCEHTGKTKELIGISELFYKNGLFQSEDKYLTSFSSGLGFNWKLWMSLREAWSNMVDEGGFYTEGSCSLKEGTLIQLFFDDNSEFAEVVRNKHLYILDQEEPCADIGQGVSVYNNEENFLRIYKNGILVHSDEKVPSRFAYNIKFGELDERRVLLDVYSEGRKIYDAITHTTNEDFIRKIVTRNEVFEDGDFLNSFTEWYESSDLISRVASEIYAEHEEVFTIKGLMEGIKKRKDCSLPGRKLKTLTDSYFSYTKEVTLDKVVELKEKTAINRIQELYNFTVDVEVKESDISGSTVIADKYNKCLIIDPSTFNAEVNFDEFLIQYVHLTKSGNVINNLAAMLVQKLKK